MAIDYEYRIKLLEAETAHLKEMQQIARDRQDTTDERLTRLEALSKETTESVKLLAQTVDKLAAKMDGLTAKMDGLIDAITAQQRNGKGQA